MKCFIPILLIILIAVNVSSADTASELKSLKDRIQVLEKKVDGGSSDYFFAYWDSGLRLKTQDENFKIKIGGRIHNDWAFFDVDSSLEASVEEMESGTEFRRAEFYSEGLLYNSVEYKIELEFANELGFEDVYVALRSPVGTIRVGHDEEPFCMEELTSNKYITFMERNLPDALAPKSNTGISIRNEFLNKRIRYATGVYRKTGSFGENQGNDETSFTTRITGAPVYSDKGRKVLHLGTAYSIRQPNDDEIQYRQRPDAHMAEYLVDTDIIMADNVNLWGAEAAVVLGSFSLQGEYINSSIDVKDGENANLNGYYIMGSYFLTGEHRPYELSEGVFGRAKPKNNFRAGQKGKGAWELATRFSSIDLEDGDINGGTLNAFTTGLNWYINPSTRVMFNYVLADTQDKYDGELAVAQMRVQIDF